MIKQTPNAQFRQQLRNLLTKETLNSPSLTIMKGDNVYKRGDSGDTVYFIEKGHVKLVMTSDSGQECVLASRRDGDIFGELSLSQLGIRHKTVSALEDTVLKEIPSDKFLLYLKTAQLLEGLIRYLALNIIEQEQIIVDLVTIDNEQRLGQILLKMACTKGQKDPLKLIIKLDISHEELSNLIGTTWPRVSLFIQRFSNLNLLEISSENFLIIKEKKLADYLAQITR